MATTLAEFENGLMRIGHKGTVHLIHPMPKGLRPLCKPNMRDADAKAQPVTHTDAPTCRDCVRISGEGK